MNYIESLKSKNNGMLLPIQAVAEELGIKESGVEELITTGRLSSIPINGNKFVSAQAIANMLGCDSTHFGQNSSGQTDKEALYYIPEYEYEVDSMKKREYRGTVSKLSDGTFIAQVVIGWDAKGQRIRKSARFSTEEAAQKHVDEKVSILNAGGKYEDIIIPATPTTPEIVGNYTNMTFEEYCIKRLNEGVGRAMKRTIEGYRTALAPIIREIGEKKIVEINEEMLKPVFIKLSYHYKQSSLTKSFRTVRMIMTMALEDGDIPNDVFNRLKCPRSQKPDKKKRKAYTEKDREIIMKCSKDYHNKMLYPIFALLDCTGMRPSELRALEWSSFNAKAKEIYIYQAVTKVYEDIEDITIMPKFTEIISTVKSDYSNRTLRLTDMVVEALIDWRKELDTMPRAMRESKFIFPSQSGDFRSETSMMSLIHRFEDKYNLKSMDIEMYRFRHTFCTNLLLAGRPVSVVQLLMGDNSPDVVMKIYNDIQHKQADEASKSFYENLNKYYIDNGIFAPKNRD